MRSTQDNIARAGIAVLLLGLPAFAAEAQLAAASPKATLNLAADRTAFEPGDEATVTAWVTIESGWHVNSHAPTYDYLIATELTFTLPQGWAPPRIDYPEGELETFTFAELPLSVYQREVAIRAILSVPPGTPDRTVAVAATLRYQACDDRSCLAPTTTEASLDLAIGRGGMALTEPPAGSVPRVAATHSTSDSGARSSRGPVLLLLALLGGLILNAMPCVLPVLSLKLFGLVKSAGSSRREVVSGSLATAAGILVSFWALAAAAIVARGTGHTVGWGVQFQQPVFVTFLTVVVLLFTLNLWGLFEIPLPAFAARLGGGKQAEGLAGHFGTGLFATLMATPCSAPFLGTAVGFALTQPATTVLGIFSAVGIGMALPYLALALTPRAVRLLPKPGAWMDGFRIVMGFLLAATAVWLLYVLSSQVSRERLAFVQLLLLAMAMGLWFRQRSRRSLASGLLAALALAAALGAVALAQGGSRPDGPGLSSRAERLIPWTEFDRAEAERLAAEGRLVFVDVTADWCFTCKVNERLVLETREVADAFERREVIAMKADWTNRNDAIADFLAAHGRYGIPFYLLYRPGQAPQLFSEVLTKDAVINALEEAF